MLWIVDVDLDIEVVLLIKYSAFIKYLGKTVNTVRELVRLVGLKKACGWASQVAKIMLAMQTISHQVEYITRQPVPLTWFT